MAMRIMKDLHFQMIYGVWKSLNYKIISSAVQFIFIEFLQEFEVFPTVEAVQKLSFWEF